MERSSSDPALRATRTPWDDADIAPERDEPAGDDARDRIESEVRRALAEALTDKQREVVEMHFFEGLSQGEIARKIGVSQQVVQKRLYGASRGGKLVGGAIARLRAELAPLVLGEAPARGGAR